MLFNPITNELFTDSGQLIKRLHCPYTIAWEDLTVGPDSSGRLCSQCSHNILDTSMHSEAELLQIMTDKPATCLQVNIQNPNIRITHESF